MYQIQIYRNNRWVLSSVEDSDDDAFAEMLYISANLELSVRSVRRGEREWIYEPQLVY